MSGDGSIGGGPVGSSHFILGFSWEVLSIGGYVGHEFVILSRHFTVSIELGDLIALDNLEDDTSGDGGSSDGTATNLEESSFVLHI